jgi:hypothetical protein
MNGIYINENLDLEEPATDKAYEFAWLLNPLPLKAATRSSGNSVAITGPNTRGGRHGPPRNLADHDCLDGPARQDRPRAKAVVSLTRS